LQESALLIKNINAPLTGIVLGHGEDRREYLPLDVDVSPFDNSKTKKEGVYPAHTKGLMVMPLIWPT